MCLFLFLRESSWRLDGPLTRVKPSSLWTWTATSAGGPLRLGGRIQTQPECILLGNGGSKGAFTHGPTPSLTGSWLVKNFISKEMQCQLKVCSLECLQVLLWQTDPAGLMCQNWTAEGISRVTVRRKSKPISPKVYAQLLNTKRKRKVHEVSKPMASLSLIPFPFALHSLSSSRLAVTHGHHKPKQGREVSYTISSQFHKVSPWAMCLKVELVPKTVSFSFYFFFHKQEADNTHPMDVFVPFRRQSLNTVELRRSSKLPEWLTCVIIRRQNNIQ